MNLDSILSLDFKSNVLNKVDVSSSKGIFNSNINMRDILLYEIKVGKIKITKLLEFLEMFNFDKKFTEDVYLSNNIKIEYIIRNRNMFNSELNKLQLRDDFSFDHIYLLPNGNETPLTLTSKIKFNDLLEDLSLGVNNNYVWNWYNISKSKYLDPNYVLEYPNLPWKNDILLNPNINENVVGFLIENRNFTKSNSYLLSSIDKGYISFSYFMELYDGSNIFDILEKELSYMNEEFLTKYKDLILDIDEYDDYNSDIVKITEFISLDFVSNNLEFYWDFDDMSLSKFVTESDIEKYPNIPLKPKNIENNYFSFILKNLNSKMEFNEEEIYKLNNHEIVVLSFIVNMDFIEKYNLLHWDWKDISKNRNLTNDFILKYKDDNIRLEKFPNSVSNYSGYFNFYYDEIAENFATNIE